MTVAKRFSVWNGTAIDPYWRSVAHIREAIMSVRPTAAKFTGNPEWLVKAGEAGTWQRTWDSHPLALGNQEELRKRIADGVAAKLKVVPYIVIRGRGDWIDAELTQIAQCAAAAKRVVLNLEPGSAYWNGPTNAAELNRDYIGPMWDRIIQLTGKHFAATVSVEVAAIPRQWVVDALGGDNNDPNIQSTLEAWREGATDMSWECYDAVAPDLDVAASMARVKTWLQDTPKGLNPRFYVPIVQQSRIDAWATTPYAAHGLECWHLDGD